MNVYDYKGYYQDYLNNKRVSLSTHYEISPLEMHIDIDYKAIIDWSHRNFSRSTIKDFKPQPFTPPESMQQAVMLQQLGYTQHNTTEINWGIEPEDDAELKYLIGSEAFEKMNIKKDASLVRLLRYDPGQCIPLHTDSYNGFKNKFGDGNVKRFFVAVSPWDWGHFLQIHDNMIHHWAPGYTVEIPNEIFHLSGNCGISPKYTLTITGFVA